MILISVLLYVIPQIFQERFCQKTRYILALLKSNILEYLSSFNHFRINENIKKPTRANLDDTRGRWQESQTRLRSMSLDNMYSTKALKGSWSRNAIGFF